MNAIASLVQWWNLPFTLPFALAVLYLLLTAYGLTPGEGSSGDGATAEAAVDGAEADAGHNLNGDQHSVEQHDQAASPVGRVLDLLGLGRVPLAIVLQTFLLIWGFSGWMATSFLAQALSRPEVFIWPALLIAAIASVTLTLLLARPLARWLPSAETYSLAKEHLTGRLATVVFPVSATGGMVHLRDDRGNLHQLSCRLLAHDQGETAVLPKGSEVVVYDYDAATGQYLVAVSDLPALPLSLRRSSMGARRVQARRR